VLLQHSTVIQPRQRPIYVDELGRLHQEPISNENIEYLEYRETRKTIKGITTPRKIQLYRWWFRFLKLGLELEQKGHTFEERQKVTHKKKGKVGYRYKTVREKVVVNRNKYKGWDLDQVLTDTFDNWWKTHSHLFIETPDHIKEITSGEEFEKDENYRYFRIDTRMTTNDSIRSLRKLLNSQRRSSRRTSLFTPTGETRQEKLFNCYNTLVMSLNGKSPKEILSSGLFRKSRGREISYIENLGRGGRSLGFFRKGSETTRSSKENLDRLRDLLVPGRRLVLTVCDGYFTKHPRDKQYFRR